MKGDERAPAAQAQPVASKKKQRSDLTVVLVITYHPLVSPRAQDLAAGEGMGPG